MLKTADLFAFLMGSVVTSTACAAELPADLGGKLAHAYITPATQDFHQSSRKLHASLQSWCATPSSSAGKQKLESDFAQAVRSWSGIEFLRFGPLVAANRFERVYFWPDPRGILPRQIQGVLRNPAAVPDAAQLRSHSVALQGLPALEYVFYRDQGLLSGQAKDFAAECAYAVSVAGNLASLSAELAEAWGDAGEYTQKFAQPSASNPLYRTSQEVAGEAIKAISTGLQFARDVKLTPVLGADTTSSRYQRAPFWRSGLTVPAMAASAQGMLAFYRAGGYQYASGERWVDASIQNELQRVIDNFEDMDGDIQALLASDDGYLQLTLATLLLKNAKGLVDEYVAPALGVRLGFNALDGD